MLVLDKETFKMKKYFLPATLVIIIYGFMLACLLIKEFN